MSLISVFTSVMLLRNLTVAVPLLPEEPVSVISNPASVTVPVLPVAPPRGLPLVDPGKITARDRQGRSVWVTRARPKVDRIACPWLIRRFVDPRAVFLYVAPAEIASVAETYGAMPFDVEDTFWSHRGELCTFDVMLAELGLLTPALDRLAAIVRGADTARPELAPEAPGLLAASLGLSRMYADDLEQLEAGMALYDAFYRWCRDATDETHNWPTNRTGGAA